MNILIFSHIYFSVKVWNINENVWKSQALQEGMVADKWVEEKDSADLEHDVLFKWDFDHHDRDDRDGDDDDNGGGIFKVVC